MMKENFLNLIDEIKDRRVYIQTHNSPDPDAIASAAGLQFLLERMGVNAVICYKGEIEKYNTVRMIELFGIKISHISDISDMKSDDAIILVDSQKGNSNITDFPGDEVAVIDHHPIFVENTYLYSDIRPKIGACSSMIASYIFDIAKDIDKNIATLLLYGIKMDTLDLSRGVSELDIDMFYVLYKRADLDMLKKLQINTLEYDDLAAYSNAIRNIKIYGKIGFSNTGAECPDSLLGTVSDFILALKEVDVAVVFSEKNGGIKVSIRSEDDSIDAGKVISEALKNVGNGGGHKSMAGGFIDSIGKSKIKGDYEHFMETVFLEAIRELK